MKKLLTLAVALLGFAWLATLASPVPLAASATSSALGAPGAAGRPQSLGVANARVEGRYEIGIADMSFGKNVPTVLSGGSSVLINVTFTTGLSPSSTTAPYAGLFKAYIINNGPTSVVAFASMSGTSVANTACAGVLILTNTQAILDIQSRDGIQLHLQGLTATAGPISVGFGNY